MSASNPRYDFHTHTFFSDGDLLPTELARRAFVKGNRAIAITDHASDSNLEDVISAVTRDCALIDEDEIIVIPGIELSYVPPHKMDMVIKRARKFGAKVIVVHGESPVEPVHPGTNREAARNPEVDILAHPGFITEDEAQLAKDNDVYLEITCRSGHSLTNGHVRTVGTTVGAKFLINTDAHTSDDISTAESARRIALGSGMSEAEANRALLDNPLDLLGKLGFEIRP